VRRRVGSGLPPLADCRAGIEGTVLPSARKCPYMEVHHVTEDAETFTQRLYLVVGDRTTLVDAGAMDGVVDEIASTPTTSRPSS